MVVLYYDCSYTFRFIVASGRFAIFGLAMARALILGGSRLWRVGEVLCMFIGRGICR